MLPVVRQAYPDHSLFAEEAGRFDGTEPYHWIIDPLDGTNNFVSGLPTFASAVSVLRDGEPVVAAVYLPATEETYLARRGSGVRYQGSPVGAERTVPLDAATVVTIVGRDVPRNEKLSREAKAISQAVETDLKRVCSSWAPTVHAGLFSRGRMQGLVQFHADEEEQAVVELLAVEADAVVRRDGPLFVAACDERMLSVLWQAALAARQ